MSALYTVEVTAHVGTEFSGVISAQFYLSSMGGTMGATVVLDRQMGDLTINNDGTGIIANGQEMIIIEATPTTVWRGYIEEYSWAGMHGPLTIRCVGYGQRELSAVFPMQVYGGSADTGENPGADTSITTVGAAVDDLYDTYLAGGSITKGTIEGTDTTISVLKLDGRQSLFDILNDLAVMAGGYVWGIDEAKVFFFKALPSTDTTYAVGQENVAAVSGVRSTTRTKNRLEILGGWVGDAQYHRTFNATQSQTDYGIRKETRFLPSITNDTDAETWANAFFEIYGVEQLNATVTLAGLSNGAAIPTPWDSRYRVQGLLGEEQAAASRRWTSAGNTYVDDTPLGTVATLVSVDMTHSIAAEMHLGHDPIDPYQNFVHTVEQIAERKAITFISKMPADEAGGGEAEATHRYHYAWYPATVTDINAGPTYDLTEYGDGTRTWSAVQTASASSQLFTDDTVLLMDRYDGPTLDGSLILGGVGSAIGVEITAVNGGGTSYNCKSVDNASVTFSSIVNNGDSILAVGDKVIKIGDYLYESGNVYL